MVRPEIEIFPHRLPSDETLTKFLFKVGEVRGIVQISMQGPHVYYERKIEVSGEMIPLNIQVGKFWIEFEKTDVLEEAYPKLRDICDETFPHGFDIRIGKFTKQRKLEEDPHVIRSDVLRGRK